MFKQALRFRTSLQFRPTISSFIARSKHTLPALEYPVEGGVQPCFDGEQLNYHYNKHHNTYVTKLNDMIQGTDFETLPLDKIIVKTQGEPSQQGIYNNAAQHFNHSFFWKCLRPNPSNKTNEPTGDLKAALEGEFGSVEAFKKEFTDAGIKLFGSGWVWLVMDKSGKLKIWSGSNAECPLGHGLVPILTADVWEHAYYLVHKNQRDAFLRSFWSVVNYDFAADNFKIASQ